MSALFDALIGEQGGPPLDVDIGGGRYLVYFDFRHWMRVESVLLDGRLEERKRAEFILSSLTPAMAAGQIPWGGPLPFSTEAAMKALQWFYNCARDAEPKGEGRAGRPAKKTLRGYDFRHDIGLIYAAFKAEYGIDLMNAVDMHWWVFRALFDGLPGHTAIRELMQARVREIDKPTAAQKEAREAIALPEHLRYFEPSAKAAETLDEWAASIRARMEGQK